MSHTSAVELPETRASGQPATPGPRSRLRSPWMTPLAALALLLVMAVGLEVFHRHELRVWVRGSGGGWSTAQKREFASAYALVSLGRWRGGAQRLEAVAQRWPDGAVAAAAWDHAALAYGLARERQHAMRCTQQAAVTARPGSALFGLYHFKIIAEHVQRGDSDGAIAAVRRAFGRAPLASQRAELVQLLMLQLRRKEGPGEALRAYESLVSTDPALTQEPRVVRALAQTYLELGNTDKARPLLEALAKESGSKRQREWAKRKLTEMGSASSGN